jgi:hypothetical protein
MMSDQKTNNTTYPRTYPRCLGIFDLIGPGEKDMLKTKVYTTQTCLIYLLGLARYLKFNGYEKSKTRIYNIRDYSTNVIKFN